MEMQAEMPISHFELRSYQKECIEAIPEKGSFLIQMATGLGKTVTFSQIPRRGRMLILSHRDELVMQPQKYFDCSFGIEQGENKSNGEEVVSASVQSLVRRLNRFRPDDFDLIVTDEAHHCSAASYRKIHDYFKPRLHLGFTATPNRHDGTRLDDVFEDIVFERDLEWGIKNGWLTDIKCLRADVGYDVSQVAMKLGDYAQDELDKAVNIEGANRAIADAYRKYAVGQTLIFAVSVNHAKAIAKEIPGAVAVIGGEKRAEILENFKQKEIRCLVNCMVFTEGTDLPNIETVIICRPTQNQSLYTQMAGRGTRLCEGKEYLTLIDCVGASRLPICTAPSLLGVDTRGVPEKTKIEGNLFDLPEVVERAIDTPKCWIRNVELVSLWAKEKKYNLHGINFFKTARGVFVLSKPRFSVGPVDKLGRVFWNGSRVPFQKAIDEIYMSLCAHHSDSRQIWDLKEARRWGEYRATEKQVEMVKRFLPDFDTDGLTKFEAGQLLTRCFYG